MTNEELATAAKNGDGAALAELWQRVRRLVNLKAAQQFGLVAEMDSSISLDDLQQDAAEVFVTFVRDGWRDDLGCSFVTALCHQIRWKLYRRLDIQNKYAADSPRMVSLDTPLQDDDGDTLLDTLEDESAQIPLESVAPRADLAEAMAELPEEQRRLIRLHYWQSLTWPAVAQRVGGMTADQARGEGKKALNALRRNRRLSGYREDVDWRHVTLAEWRRTFTSAVEVAVERREEMIQRSTGQKC